MMVAALFSILVLAGCAGEPPAGSEKIIENLRTGFNDEDADQYCENFSETIFGMGHTKGEYLGQIREFKREYGTWLTEKYKGGKDNIHKWRVDFKFGKMDLKLVLSSDMQVNDIYWYPVK